MSKCLPWKRLLRGYFSTSKHESNKILTAAQTKHPLNIHVSISSNLPCWRAVLPPIQLLLLLLIFWGVATISYKGCYQNWWQMPLLKTPHCKFFAPNRKLSLQPLEGYMNKKVGGAWCLNKQVAIMSWESSKYNFKNSCRHYLYN